MHGEIVFSSGPEPDLFSSDRPYETVAELSTSGGSPLSEPGTSGLTFIGRVVLHNRIDLRTELSPHLAPLQICDERLVTAAYEKWGLDCAQHLLGEFAFVIWDPRKQHVYCCRDHLGAVPFVYYVDHTAIVFSTDARHILKNPRVSRKPNIVKLAALGFPGGMSAFEEETFHAGIRCLLPGFWMTVTRGGIHRQAYWEPRIQEGLVPRCDEEVFESLGNLLKTAVECRMEGSRTPAALLSGGLDSSAVVSLSARCMRAQERSLMVFSAVVAEELRAQFPDERAFIGEFHGYPGLKIEYVTASDRGPFDSLDDLRRFELNFLQSSRRYVYDAIESAAVSQGADVLLEGDGGEFGPSNWGGSWLMELAVRGRWSMLLRQMKSLHAGGLSPIREITSEFIDLVFPNRGFRPRLLLRRDFVRSFQQARPRIGERRLPDQRSQQARQIRGWLARSAIRLDVEAPSAGIKRAYPLLDRRVIDFCVSAPASLKVKDGYRRYLIRRALEGVLPRRIQWRTSKGPFSPDYYARYNRQIAAARTFLATVRPRDPVRMIVDVEALSRSIEGPPARYGDLAALNLVPTTLYLICFLRQFPEFRL